MNINDRIKIIKIEDIEIWDGDYSGVSEKDFLNLIDLQLNYSKARANEISFFLLNVEKSPKSMKVIDSSKKAVLDSQGLKSINALYNVDRLGRILLKIINVTQNNEIYTFDNKEEAMAHLIGRARKMKLDQGDKKSKCII